VVESAVDRDHFHAGLDGLHRWADPWQMQYNVDKCHILHVGKKKSKHDNQPGGRSLEASKSEKDVGVMINDDLKPSLQCARAAANTNQVLGQIARGVFYGDKETILDMLLQEHPGTTLVPQVEAFFPDCVATWKM
jgi:hypothetical protein